MRAIVAMLFALTACSANANYGVKNMESTKGKLEVATFGQGCYWCAEAIFQRLEGVIKVESGFSGGTTVNPSYKEVCTGLTGHAEVVQVTFDPDIISFDELLEVFWKTHDPTTLNQQGNDIGTQYRSVIFYHNEEQQHIAEAYKRKLDEQHIWDDPILTEIVRFKAFYKADRLHQNYFDNNSEQPYCQLVILPKLEKFEKVFKNRLKK